jgi:hypothetical protein
MGFAKVDFDVSKIKARIAQGGERCVRGGKQILEEEAEIIVQLAGDFAPRDDGTLEEASSFKIREVGGKNNRTDFEIALNSRKRDEKGKRVALYGAIQHENLEPFGDLNLGPRSQEKNDGQAIGVRSGFQAAKAKVGGKFLERALQSRVGQIGKRIAERVRRALK